MSRLRSLCVAGALLVTTSSFAQNDMSDVEIRTERINESLAVLFGRGGNIGVFYGVDGVFLIDDQYAPLTDKIVAAVGELSEQPIRYVFNTHWHGDHTGGNETLGQQGSIIVAHDNVYERMSTEQFMELFDRTVPASPDAALPEITFSQRARFRLNGETVTTLHVPKAHTDGDSLVHFADSNALHMGDTYFASGYPFVDLGSGGSIQGLIAAVDKALAMSDGETVIIPGHGPIGDKESLRDYHHMLTSIRDRVAEAIEAGDDLAKIQAAGVSVDFDERWGGGFIKADRFISFVYESLKQ